jgi:hypothetical protein
MRGDYMITLEIKKCDEDLAKEIYNKCRANSSYNEMSGFDGNMLIQIVLPLATVLSPVLLKYIENKKVTVKFDGIEITANKKDIPQILETIQKQRNRDKQE